MKAGFLHAEDDFTCSRILYILFLGSREQGISYCYLFVDREVHRQILRQLAEELVKKDAIGHLVIQLLEECLVVKVHHRQLGSNFHFGKFQVHHFQLKVHAVVSKLIELCWLQILNHP